MTVSEYLLQLLENEGVSHIFGVAGDALNPFVNAISSHDQIKWVSVKHEGNGAFAAFAQGEVTGNLGVCASTVGPGALHLINGLYNAKKERSPVIAITGQIPVSKIGNSYHQEVDLKKVYDDVCTYQAILRTKEDAAYLIQRAVRIAINEKTVCRIELPADIASQEIEGFSTTGVIRSKSSLIPHQEELIQAADLINSAKRIGILAGAGCRNSRKEVLALSSKLKAPITHSLRAADIFDHAEKNVVGLTGLIGNPSGYAAVMDCDLLLMLGTDFPYSDFLPSDKTVIQIDTRIENIGARVNVQLGLHGDVGATLGSLTPLLPDRLDSAFLNQLTEEFGAWKLKMKGFASLENAREPMHPQVLSRIVSLTASSDALFVIETGTSAIWASNFMSFHENRRMIGAFNHGSMAVGLPAAIGAQMINTEREVWCLSGDGAFHMCMQEFTTAVDNDLPLKIIIFNNEQLGFVKIEMEEAGLKPNLDALKVSEFDFAEYARLCGGDGIKLESVDQIEEAVAKAKASTKPYILDARVTNGALSLPPKIGWDEIKGFGLSKLKSFWAAMNGDEEQLDNIKEEAQAYLDKL